MIGDSMSDLAAAHAAGVGVVLVPTNQEKGEFPSIEVVPAGATYQKASNLLKAVELLTAAKLINPNFEL